MSLWESATAFILSRALGRPEWIADLPEAWRRVWFGFELWQWLGLVALFAVAALTGLVAFRVLAAVFHLERRLRSEEVALYSGRGIRRAASALIASLAFGGLLGVLDLDEVPRGHVVTALFVVQIAFGVWLATAIWGALCDVYAFRRRNMSRKAATLLLPFARKLGALLIGAVGMALVISGLGYNVAGFLAGLGIGGVAVALAAKNTVENFFGSLTVMLDVPFGVGDWIKVAGVSGIVEETGLRTTRIRTFDDALVTLPNSLLTQQAVENLGMRRRRRYAAHLWFAADATPEAIESFVSDLRAHVATMESVIQEDASVSLYDATIDGFDVQAVVYFDVPSFTEEMAGRQALLLGAMSLAAEHGLAFAQRVRG